MYVYIFFYVGIIESLWNFQNSKKKTLIRLEYICIIGFHSDWLYLKVVINWYLLRIGGRSKSDVLEPYTLNAIKQYVKDNMLRHQGGIQSYTDNKEESSIGAVNFCNDLKKKQLEDIKDFIFHNE